MRCLLDTNTIIFALKDALGKSALRIGAAASPACAWRTGRHNSDGRLPASPRLLVSRFPSATAW